MFSPEIYAARRDALAALMQLNSIALFPANPEQTRTRDTEFPFRQDSDLLYLTGMPEPEALLVLIKDQDGVLTSVLFCRDKDPLAEIWQGRRIGPEVAPSRFGVNEAVGEAARAERLRDLINGRDVLYYAQGHLSGSDAVVFETLAQLRAAPKKGWKAPAQLHDTRPLLAELRLIKSDEELAVMRRAAELSAAAHCRAMRICRPGMYEYQLAAEIHHEFAMNGASGPSYGTIVGGGDNGCILHYTENSDVLKDGDLVLIDAGAEVAGYAGDITRTFPVNGRFSDAQRALYEVVLAAELAAIATIKPGSTVEAMSQAAIAELTRGLVDLGILSGDVETLIADAAYKPYFMHGIGHWLGLDVHDVGEYKPGGQPRPFLPGMVVTVEPGLYIAADAPVDPRWRGIGIRVEDDVAVTTSGHDVLTSAVPKTVADIEALMASGRRDGDHA